MATPMFGVESEYAIAGIQGKQPMPQEELVSELVRLARGKLAHLPDMCSPSGMFLENGARFYIDCGLHPEMATPECTTPWELTTYIKAGERILEKLIAELQAKTGATAEIMCFRCNVDYSGSGSSWGCHESYLHGVNPASLPGQLISHLVTRVVYTGAGGFNPLSSGLEFCVAPRLMHIQKVVSSESTVNRGIFHTKNEPLAADGNNRLHILCGESLCSETAIALKIGATALVVAMAQEGLKPEAELQLASPLEALHAVSSDMNCTRKLRLSSGGEATALEIQRRLLQIAEHNLGLLPPWGAEICALWRLTLDQLAGGPDAVSTVLDWAIKRRLFFDRAARCGVPPERFTFFNSIAKRLHAALAGAGVKNPRIPLERLRGPQSPIPDEVAQLEHMLDDMGLAWADLARFLNLRDDLYQIDTRFGQIGPRGIFSEMDRRGMLHHKLEAASGVEAAMSQPPSVGRARLRGEAVRQLSGQPRAACNWMVVFGPDNRRLDLSDPFATAEVWTDLTAAEPDGDDLPLELLLDEYRDPGLFRQTLAAIRGRRGRSQTRAQRSSPQTGSDQ